MRRNAPGRNARAEGGPGIATVISSGNNGYTDSMHAPACISSAVSVGSTGDTDAVSWFSNSAPSLSLLAPGEAVYSSVPSGGFTHFQGTSMAAPHVAGAWALLKQQNPSASVASLLSALQSTGLPVADTRVAGGVTKPRIKIADAAALLALPPDTVINSGPPARTKKTRATFGFSSPESDLIGFQCRLDAKAWANCSSPKTYTSLSKKRHTFQVKAVGSAGVATDSDPTPAIRRWTVRR